MPYGLDEHANPVFLISTMAMRTQNVQADPRSSLLTEMLADVAKFWFGQ
jgi:putative heme iron utilization protein